jgi:hypothetical protein
VTLIVSGKAGTVALQPRPFPAERQLQESLFRNPDVIPLHELKEDARLLTLATEFQTSSGPIDVLAIDNEGDLYLIEAKLFRNPDKRQVIGQALDYGAALRRDLLDAAEFRERLESSVQRCCGGGLFETLRRFLGGMESAAGALLDDAHAKLKEGLFTFIVLMDRVDPRLRELLTFVNEKSNFSILAVEVVSYAHDGQEFYLPRLIGAEAEKQVFGGSAQRTRWTEQRFFEAAEGQLSYAQVAVLRKVYEWARRLAKVKWGTGTQNGSFNPEFEGLSRRSPITVWSNGNLTLKLNWLSDGPAARHFAQALFNRWRESGIPLDTPEREIAFQLDDWSVWADQLMTATESVAFEQRSVSTAS